MTNLNPITQIQLMSGGYYLSRCLQVVAELGIADFISDEPISAAELAQSTGSHPEALGRALSLLCAHGVFERVNGRFRHSASSRVLRTDHPMSMRPFARMFGIPILWQAVMRLDESVATGRPMGDEVTPGGFWHYFEQHPDANEKFNHAMVTKCQSQLKNPHFVAVEISPPVATLLPHFVSPLLMASAAAASCGPAAVFASSPALRFSFRR